MKVFKRPCKTVLNCSAFDKSILVPMNEIHDDRLLLARSLVMILIEVFKREMGLKSETFLAPSFFGINVM
jgi:hypothetical protein